MIWLRFLRWWSLKPFKSVHHFRGSTRDERHFEFLQCYWSHRLAGCGHKASLMLARMELRILRIRTEDRRKMAETLAECKKVLDSFKPIERPPPR